MGRAIHGRENVLEITYADIVNEAVQWGLRRNAVDECVTKTLDAVYHGLTVIDIDRGVQEQIQLRVDYLRQRRKITK